MKQHIIIHRFLGFLLLIFMCSRINVWGNSASISGEGFKNISNNSISWNDLLQNGHVQFKLSGGKFDYSEKNLHCTGNNAMTLSWVVNTGFTINVTRVTVEARSAIGWASQTKTITVGSTTSGDIYKVSTTQYVTVNSQDLNLGNDGTLVIKTSKYDANYYIHSIKVTYTITPNAPTLSDNTAAINVTTDINDKQSIDLTNYFSSSFLDDSHKNFLSFYKTGGEIENNAFYSNKAGTYIVYANVAKSDCHEQSANSNNLTITVNRVDGFIETKGASMKALDTYDLSTCIKSSLGTGTISYEVVSDNKSSATISGNNFTPSASGTYTIKATKAQDDQYKEASTQFTVNVSRIENTLSIIEEQTIKVDDIIENVYTNNNSDAEITYAFSNINYLDETKNKGTGIISFDPATKKIVGLNGGSVTLTISQETTPAYAAIERSVDITVNKYDQSINWSNPDLDLNLIVGTTTNSSATATSGLGVTYTSSNTDAITVDADGTLHTVGLGTSTITAIQEGNYQFNPATSISREFSVGEKKQATFTPAWESMTTDIKVGTTTSIELTNIATDNTFTISSSSDGIISWSRSENTLTINALKAGTTTLTLSQEGNAILNGNQASYEITVSRYPNTFAVESESKSMNVEDTWTGVITNAGNDNTQVSYSVEGVATYDVNTNTITAIGQGATTIMLSQAANDDHDGITKLLTVTVSKVTNTLGVSLPATEMNVEGTINIATENQNSPVSILATITEQQLSSSVNNGTNVITYENGVITARNAGTAKIQFTQAETTKYTGYTSNTYTITVSKMGNPITVTLDGEQRNSKNIARNTTVALAYSSPSNATYSVTLRDGSSNVTTLNGTNFISGSVDGTDIWDITQPETYKYESAETSIRIKVNSIAEAEGYVYTGWINDGQEWTGMNKDCDMQLSGVPDVLTFEAYKTGAGNMTISVSIDGSNWTKFTTKSIQFVSALSTNPEYTYYTIENIPEGVRYIRFHGSDSYHHYHNVRVTRKTYVRPSIDKTDLGDVYTDKTATATISVDYSSTNGGNISIESNNPRFTVNPASINVANNSDNVGNPSTITITYTPDPEYLGEEEATITVSDLFYSNDIKVKATAQKYPTTINKKYEDATEVNLKVDGTITDAFAFTGTSAQKPTANSNDDFYYSISHSVNAVTTGSAHPTEVISYDPATNTITALNAGTASLTIYQKKTNLYNATSQTYNFTVRKLDNPVNIALSATTLDVDGTTTVNLTNKVSDGVLSATFESIGYTNESQNREGGLLSFTGNTLTAVNAGTAKVTITQEETYKYLATSATFDVTVNKLAQMLTWDNPNLETSMQKGNTLEGNTATSDAGLTPVTYTSSNTASILVDVNTGVLTAVETGSNIVITASQAGNYKYAPASLTRQFSVFNKQTPTFVTDGNFTETNGRIALEGTATITVTGVSNDEDFTITNMNSDIISVSRNGETITIEGLSVGTANLTLSQVANDDYLGKTQEYTIEVYLPDDYLILTPSTEPSFNGGTYSKVKLNRTLKQGYNTLSLPFDTEVAILTGRNNSDDWVAQLALVTYNGNDGYTLYFTKVTDGVITANQPYILHLGAELVNPSWTNMTVVAAQGETVSVAKNYDWSMISNYTPNFSMEGKYGVVNSTGKIQKGANGSTLNAFTAYFTYTGAANVKAVVSYLDNEGELTKIEGVDFDDSTENETIYDLQGRKVEKPGKGIYIINGKKIHK